MNYLFSISIIIYTQTIQVPTYDTELVYNTNETVSKQQQNEESEEIGYVSLNDVNVLQTIHFQWVHGVTGEFFLLVFLSMYVCACCFTNKTKTNIILDQLATLTLQSVLTTIHRLISHPRVFLVPHHGTQNVILPTPSRLL